MLLQRPSWEERPEGPMALGCPQLTLCPQAAPSSLFPLAPTPGHYLFSGVRMNPSESQERDEGETSCFSD